MPASDGIIAENTYLESLASDIYRLCTKLFGQPVDPKTPYRIFRHNSYSVCCYNRFTQSYDLVISDADHAREQLCSSLSQLMYERVVDKKPGAHHQPWLYSMLGYTAARWLLREKGFQQYADYCDRRRLSETDRLHIDVLRPANAFARLRNRVAGRGEYSLPFAKQAERLAIELTDIVGPLNIVKIVGATSFDSWKRELPGDQQSRVEALLAGE